MAELPNVGTRRFILFQVACWVFVIAGVGIIVSAASREDVLLGASAVIFFGGGAIAAVMLRRREPGRAQPAADRASRTGWFIESEPVDDHDPRPFDDREITFLRRLRGRASAWPAAGTDSVVMRFDSAPTLVAAVSVGHNPELLVLGVHVTIEAVWGGRLHNQLYDVEADSGSLALPRIRSTGDVAELVEQVAAWFDACLRRPVERWEWWHDGRPYAVRYQFADTKEGLVEAYVREAAPPGQHERLIEAGSFRGRQWIRTAGIGAPDVVRAIRVDGAVQPAPGLPQYLWYECPLEVP